MIKGLYEAHLPVSDLKRSIEYYKGLGLEFSHGHEDNLAFFWIEKGNSWLGLWETEKVELEYHPSIRHIAFQFEGTLKHGVKKEDVFDDLDLLSMLRSDYEKLYGGELLHTNCRKEISNAPFLL